jgi:hypothetical protein
MKFNSHMPGVNGVRGRLKIGTLFGYDRYHDNSMNKIQISGHGQSNNFQF